MRHDRHLARSFGARTLSLAGPLRPWTSATPRTGTFARAGKSSRMIGTTWFGRRRDADAPGVNAPTRDDTGAVNAHRRPIGNFKMKKRVQIKKAPADFPARAQFLFCKILATMDISR
jgi:hypothetical protein